LNITILKKPMTPLGELKPFPDKQIALVEISLTSGESASRNVRLFDEIQDKITFSFH